jgi:hypothetical protein
LLSAATFNTGSKIIQTIFALGKILLEAEGIRCDAGNWSLFRISELSHGDASRVLRILISLAGHKAMPQISDPGRREFSGMQ